MEVFRPAAAPKFNVFWLRFMIGLETTENGASETSSLLPPTIRTWPLELGRLGNPGLNYWTFDPIGGFGYSNAKSGFNAAVHVAGGLVQFPAASPQRVGGFKGARIGQA